MKTFEHIRQFSPRESAPREHCARQLSELTRLLSALLENAADLHELSGILDYLFECAADSSALRKCDSCEQHYFKSDGSEFECSFCAEESESVRETYESLRDYR